MAAPVLRPLSTGEVLDVSFGLYRSLFIPLLTVALISRAIPVVIQIYVQAAGGSLQHLTLVLVSMLVAVILTAIGVAATTHIVAAAYLGNSITAGDALRQAMGMLGRLIALSLMTTLVIAFGTLLLIIPGLVLFSGLALSTAVVVLESPISANDAMTRSWNLSKGAKWKIFLSVFASGVLLVVPVVVVSLVVVALGGVIGPWKAMLPIVLGGVLGMFIYPYIYVVIVVLYYDMRVRKEGFDLELLAAATQSS